MITPVPQQEIPGEGQGGFGFSGMQNTSQEGIPVPVVYGEMIVGSVVLSTRLITNKIDDTTETGEEEFDMPTSDGLNSRQLAQIVDLLCEGEIEGFPNAGIDRSAHPHPYAIGALKDVFFNNTPVLGPDAIIASDTTLESDSIKENLNFDLSKGIFQTKLGSQDQVPFTRFPQSTSSSTTQVNTVVPKGSLTSESSQMFLQMRALRLQERLLM